MYQNASTSRILEPRRRTWFLLLYKYECMYIFFLFLRCNFYFLYCWWYLEIYNWRYVEIVGNIGNFRVWSSANKCVWHTINTASRSGLKLTRPQLGQKFYELSIFNQFRQGLLEFIWTEGYSGQSSNPGLALAILVLWSK